MYRSLSAGGGWTSAPALAIRARTVLISRPTAIAPTSPVAEPKTALANACVTMNRATQPSAAPEYLTGRDAVIPVRVVDATPVDSATLSVGTSIFPLQPTYGYDFTATVPATSLREGQQELPITVFRGGVRTIFPAETLNVVSSSTPLVLFEAARDTGRLAFTRIGDAGRRGIFRIDHLSTGATVFHFELPIANGRSPTDYTASLVIKDRIRARQETITAAKAVRVRLRGLQTRQILHVTLMEDDGTSWTAAVVAVSTWNEQSVP